MATQAQIKVDTVEEMTEVISSLLGNGVGCTAVKQGDGWVITTD